MEQLSKKVYSAPKYTERVIQFGAGNFMRAFVDWQIQQMNKKGVFEGSVVVVQPISTGLETTIFPEQDNYYTVISRGILNGETVDTSEVVTTISRAINPYTEHAAYLALAEQESLEFILSNTTEAGIAFDPADKLEDAPQTSFPGKLTALLYKRYQLGGKGFTIIPCELIEGNGKKLKQCVLQYAQLWELETGFETWLEAENTFCDSLVDRIVPGYPRDLAESYHEKHGYSDKIMVMCEPYMIWVIQGPKTLEETLPLAKVGLNVIVTEDMPLYRERKVHILNGPHTMMSPLGLLGGIETVGGIMDDQVYSQFIDKLMVQEIIPSLSQPQDELTVYAESIKERFRNPFLVHNLASIMLNAVSKYKARVLPMVEWYLQKQGKLPEYMVLALAALILYYRGDKYQPTDDHQIIETIQAAWQNPSSVAESVLSNQSFWGKDLTALPGMTVAVQSYLVELEQQGACAVLERLNAEI